MNHEVLKKVIVDQREVIRKSAVFKRECSFEPNGNYVITGLRRAGKTMLLYGKVQELVQSGVSWDRIIFINFEDERLDGFSLSDFNDILSIQAEMSREKGFFFFDEIQNVPGWEKFARRLADYDERVFITGSNATMLSRDIEGRLAGRYLAKNVYTYSFPEYLKAAGISAEVTPTTKEEGSILACFHDYMTYGGFPGSLLFEDKRSYVSGVYQKVLLGDIIERNKVRNPSSLRVLVKKLAESVKDELSYTKLYNILKGIGYRISKDTVIDYIDYAMDAYLVFPLRNYFSSFSDKESTPKYYFSDNGILSLFLVDKASLLLENLIALSLARRYSEEVFYLKSSKTGLDIDFYVPGENLLIQVAYSFEKVSNEREWKNMVKANKTLPDIKENLILTYNEVKELDIDGVHITVMPVWKWLLS